ncbi:hypothetical protein [Mucilaginibacter sp.]|jgi:hypothetical protein|uniref:hypothetical protein n=1 Tax=Mucilaginibacter sp. TaxID=1882438 RepID=UPI002C059FED|nr:hypothetical protein [Mucilaginibacter sp.]HTI58790.1 hypothetical protein [Mucilaginibacter sp.]
MKQIFLIFFFFALGLPCFGQSKALSYTLSVEFSPSFMNRSTLTVRSGADSSFIVLKGYKSLNKKELSFCDTSTLKAIDLSRLTAFLKTYKLSVKATKKSTFKKKHGNLPKYEDIGFDGINVDLSLTVNANTSKYHFWSPKRGSEDGKLMGILFEIMQKAFPMDKPFGYQSYEYIKELKEYF